MALRNKNGQLIKGHKGLKPKGAKARDKTLAFMQIYNNLIGTFKSGRYYVYYHVNPENNEVFYIGKGSNNRAWDKKKNIRNDYWDEYIENMEYDVRIIVSDLSQNEALAVECALIKVKQPICNIDHINIRNQTRIRFDEMIEIKIS